MYEIHHIYPLTAAQKHSFAKTITHLHSTTFLTPSLYVNVVFHNLASSTTSHENLTYFLAGEPTAAPQGPNRILAMVRVSPGRTKAMWDGLAERVEAAWYEVVNGPEGASARTSVEDRRAKKLHMVVFYPMVAARENGIYIPDAGNERTWLKDNMPYFKSQAYEHKDEDFRKMLEEIDRREDLKQLLV